MTDSTSAAAQQLAAAQQQKQAAAQQQAAAEQQVEARRVTPEQSAAQQVATRQQQLSDTFEGQRRINHMWELTQACIAVLVSMAFVYAVVVRPNPTPSESLNSAFFVIIGFYFSRTNHTAIGGTGSKPSPPYEGR